MDFKQTISGGLPSLQKTYSFESPKYNNVPAQDWMNTEMNAVEQFGWDTFRPTSMKGYLTDVDESYLGYTDESKNDIGWHTKDPSLSDVYKRGWPDPWSTPGANVPSTKGLTPPTPLNADLWKDAGGRVLTTPSSFSKEFDAMRNQANGDSSDNSGGGLGGLTDMFKGDQSRAGSAVDMMLQAGFPPFMIMRNIKAFFEPEYDKGTLVGKARDFFGKGEEKTTTPGNMNVDHRGVLTSDPVGLAGVGNVPGQGGYRYGNVDNVGWEDPNNEGYNFGGREYVDDYQGSGQAVYDPNYDYSPVSGGYSAVSDFGADNFSGDGGTDSTGATASDYDSYDNPDDSTGGW